MIRHGFRALAVVCGIGLTAAVSADETPRDPLAFETTDTRLKLDLEAGIQVVNESRGFWNLSRVFAPTNPFRTSMTWGEAYLKPGLTLEHRLGDGFTVYGGASLRADAHLLLADVLRR